MRLLLQRRKMLQLTLPYQEQHPEASARVCNRDSRCHDSRCRAIPHDVEVLGFKKGSSCGVCVQSALAVVLCLSPGRLGGGSECPFRHVVCTTHGWMHETRWTKPSYWIMSKCTCRSTCTTRPCFCSTRRCSLHRSTRPALLAV